QLGALRLELRDLREDLREACFFAARGGDGGVELRLGLPQRPEAPSDEQRRDQQQGGAGERHLVTELEGPAGCLGRAALTGDQVDADHRSPPRRNARPTATAASGATVSGATPRRAASKSIWRNGSNGSTGAP